MTNRCRGSGRLRGPAGIAAGLVVCFALAITGTAVAQPPPPCIEYVHREEGGRVEVDLRFDPKSGTFSSLAVFWFINDIAARPGIYHWTHIVNGKPKHFHSEFKDDNVHTTFKAQEGWFFGDTYKFQATHYSPATRTHYISVVNECLITPR
jgi:hypothetical protein